jgi:hypothetical protein
MCGTHAVRTGVTQAIRRGSGISENKILALPVTDAAVEDVEYAYVGCIHYSVALGTRLRSHSCCLACEAVSCTSTHICPEECVYRLSDTRTD